MSSLAIAPILQAIRTIIKNHTPDHAQKLADLAGLTLKEALSIQHEVIEHTTQKGKVIRGVVRTDLTKDQAKEIDPYTFAKDGGWFIREKHLGQTQANNEPVTQRPVVNVKSDTLVNDKDNGIDVLIAKFKSASTDTGRADKRLDAKDGAKLLKQTLTKQFPDTKFSVVMSRGTGYGSVDVRWTDGASYDLVEVILNHFEGKGYDGMQDMATYKNAVDENGNPVDYGLGYVSGHRQYSKGFLEKFLATLPENLKDLVVQHKVGISGSDDDAYLTNNNEYWVRSRLGDALSSTSTGHYSGSARPKVQSQPEEDNSHLSLTWEKDPTRKIWRSNDGKIITDESSIVGGKKTVFFAVYQDQEEREHGNNYATGESLADAKVKAEQSPQPVTSDKLQQLIDGIKAHGAALGGYDNFKVQYQNLDWNPYKNKIKDIARDLKLAGYPKLGGFKQLFNDYVGPVNVADLPTLEPITSVPDPVITPIQDVQATPPVEAPELAGKDGYMPHDGWRNNRLKARKYAMALGLSLDGGILMPVEDIVAKIDAFNLLPTAEREARLLAITGTAEERAQALSIINAVLDENPTGEFKALHDKALNEIKEKIGKPIHQIYKDYDEFDKVFANVKEQAFLAYASRLPVAIGMGSISSSLASDAHRNTSFSPERRGRSEQISFVADMVGLWQQFDRQYNAANEETQARFKEAFASIKSKAAGLKGATLSAASRTASTMITGGSGFNVSRNQKANQVAHNRAEDYLDYLQNKAPNILRKVIRGVVDDSIGGQIVDMQKRIDVAKNNQEMMKKANAVIRKNANKSDDEQIAALVEAGFKEDFAKKIIVIPANMSMYGKGFPSFSLTNNNANIKRMEEQLTAYKARQATAEAVQANDEEIEIADVKVELNAQDNRIRLFFDGKPDSDTIAALKGSAFKWSPSNSAWQRQMTGNAIRAAEAILNDLAERTGQEKGALPKIKNEFNSTNDNDAQDVIAAIHTVLANSTPENVQALADVAGLMIKPHASKEITQEQALVNLDWLDNAEPVAAMKGDEVPRFDKVKLLTEWVGQYWEEQTGGKINRADLGEIVVDKVAAKNSAYHGMNKAKAKAFYLVPNALKNGVLLGKLPTQSGKISAFVVAAPISIDDKVYRLLMEVRSDENMQRLYVHEVVLRDNDAPLDEFKTAAASQKEAEPHSPPRGAIYNFMLNLRKVQAEKIGQDFTLSTYTEAELHTQEAALKAAEVKRQAEEKAAKDKAIADKQVNDFRLTGSSLPNDVAASYGQGDMFVQARGKLKDDLNSIVDDAAHQSATSPRNDLAEPTEAQKLAGNYKLGKITISGLSISIENPQGSTRSGIDAEGNEWSNTMQHHYGYINGTEGADGDHIDVFVVPNTPIDWKGDVYVIDQVDPLTGDFDEHKVIIGAKSKAKARRVYLANYDKDWDGLADITKMTFDDFVEWLKGDTTKAVGVEFEDRYNDIGGFNFVPAVDFDQMLNAIKIVLANHTPENVKRLAMLTGLTLKQAEPDIKLDMFGDPIQDHGFDLFGEPIQDGDDSPVDELPRLAIQELSLDKLTLSEDVPQFKSGADDESGVVEALGGKFDRTGVAPIQVWERADGRLEVISGRHRTDLARRSGEKTIPAQVHKESEGFTAKQAMMLDAELNIRDGQGKVKDYVDYFTHSEISQEEADKRGLLARSIGQRAFTIASQGSEELKTLHRNEIISDQAAADIANIAPNNSAMQAVGLRVLQEHKPLNNALNTIRAVMALTREKGQEPDTFDLFGFDDSALKEAEAMARIASRKQRQIAEQLAAIKGAVKNPKLAAKHGVIVENEADALAKVQTMTAQKARWDNWSSHADLLAEVRASIQDSFNGLGFIDGASSDGWIGVDLDGTLAKFDGWKGIENIGDPVIPMLETVIAWISYGFDVRIFTARASNPDAIPYIKAWCMEHIGQELPVTNVKDMGMAQLWDDRAVTVERNTGQVIQAELSD